MPKPSQPLIRVIAIDGPVASGKTVVGRELAARLGWRMLDTGIMYRALTWYALREGIELEDHVKLAETARAVTIEIGAPPSDGLETASILIDSEDATAHLREPQVEASVSSVAAVPGVRLQMVAQQREQAKRGALVMVGRDIGTVVVPDAALKIYLTASVDARAERRAREMHAHGRDIPLAIVHDEIVRRDGRDANRDASPLLVAAGAIELDTTDLDRDAVIQAVIDLVRKHAPELLS
ncbi:MAG: (d)CMP kinase [Chloroflexi bacterium]|nr:(d)CMP kinase [Chloroflexota bacterium]MCZ6708023.1 (d)CMP kinase [Chloroflexota bacterium]